MSFSTKSFELMIVEVDVKSSNLSLKFNVVIIYRSPGACRQSFDEFNEFLCFFNYIEQVIIIGDFNIHVDQTKDNNAISFARLLEQYEWIQHVSEITHDAGHTLDLILTKKQANLIIPSDFIKVKPSISDYSFVSSFINKNMIAPGVWFIL
jgi:hypothetical protein